MNDSISNYVEIMLLMRLKCVQCVRRASKEDLEAEDVVKKEWYAQNAKAEQIIDSLICLYATIKDEFPQEANWLKEKLVEELPLLGDDTLFHVWTEKFNKPTALYLIN